MTTLAEAAASAPPSAGVYFFLGDHRELLYVGKAANLRRRLQQHAREPAHPLRYALVREVQWEELPDDDAAAAREADLIVALHPSLNASIAGERRWAFLVVQHDADECRFSIVGDDNAPPAGSYGCFPHLGKGMVSRPGIACSDGYTGLLRLLWATSSETGHDPPPYPRSISGPSPPFEITIPVPASRRERLHRLLSGSSALLIDDLNAAINALEPYLQPALVRDLGLARGFFDYGPAAVRRLRLRHGLPPGPIGRAEIEERLLQEVTVLLGDVRLPLASRRRRRPTLLTRPPKTI